MSLRDVFTKFAAPMLYGIKTVMRSSNTGDSGFTDALMGTHTSSSTWNVVPTRDPTLFYSAFWQVQRNWVGLVVYGETLELRIMG